MADVNLGGMKLDKRMLLFSGTAAAGIIVYAYYRKRNAPASTPSDAGTGDGSINDPSIDPATGQPYDSEYSNTGAVPYGVTDPNTGYVYWGANQTVTSVSTNAQWLQAAEAYLTANGYDATTVLAALGAALAGRPITTDQRAIYDAAVAAEGYPPQGATIVMATGSSGSSGSAPSGWAYNARVTNVTKSTAAISWSAVSGATGYNILLDGRKVRSTQDTNIVLSGLAANHSYTVGISPYNHYGDDPHISHVGVHTKAK